MKLRALVLAILILNGAPITVAAKMMTEAEFVAKYAHVLDDDRVYYRWQSTTSGENLARVGTMTDGLNRHFMDMQGGTMAGPGVYVADKPLSSSAFLPKDGGNLVEVRVAKGTPVLNLMDPVVQTAMQQHGFEVHHLEHWRPGRGGVMMQFTSTWFVGKDLTDRASFRMYPGPEHSAESLVTTVHSAYAHKTGVDKQILKQIQQQRPEVIDTIVERHGLTRASAHVLSDAKLAPLVQRAFGAELNAAEADRLLEIAASEPRVVRILNAEPKLNARATAAFDVPTGGEWSNARFAALRDLALPSATETAGRRRVMKLLNTALEQNLEWSDLARLLTPILDHVRLSSDESATLARRIGELIDKAPAFGVAPDELRQILARARIEDGGLVRSLDQLDARVKRVANARASGQFADVRAALVDQSDLTKLHAVADHLDVHLPGTQVHAVVADILSAHPAAMRRLVKSPGDLDAGVRLFERVPGVEFERVYAAALGGSPSDRQSFFRSCVTSYRCSTRLEAAMIADHGALVRNVPNPIELAVALDRLHDASSERARPLTRLVIASIDDPQKLAQFWEGLSGTRWMAFGPLILKRTRVLGLDGVRTFALLKLAEIPGDAGAKRGLMLRALRNAANPADIADVATYATKHGLASHALNADLTQSFARLGADARDHAGAASRRLNLGQSPRAGAPLDCTNGLARLLDAD